MKHPIFIILFCLALKLNGQITLIPDQNFEQALINLGMDSDGVINGQVLTNDIDTVTLLNVNFNNISDLTGIEDFTALEDLDISLNPIGFPPNTIDIEFSSNSQLKHFWMIGGDDAFYNFVESIDLSQNLLLEEIFVTGNWPLRQLDLKTGGNDVQNLHIDISISPNDLQGQTQAENNNLFCIQVTDEVAATAGTGVYFTWTIVADNNPYYFSETCALGTERFLEEKVFIYPNPTSDILFFKSMNTIFSSVHIYDDLGRLIVETPYPIDNQIDLSKLKDGVYVVKLLNDTGIYTHKFIKK